MPNVFLKGILKPDEKELVKACLLSGLLAKFNLPLWWIVFYRCKDWRSFRLLNFDVFFRSRGSSIFLLVVIFAFDNLCVRHIYVRLSKNNN